MEGKDGGDGGARGGGLSGGDGDGEGCRVCRVRIVSVLVLIDPASIAVGDKDKIGGVGKSRLDRGGVDGLQISLIREIGRTVLL
jgi:hypothetical protein